MKYVKTSNDGIDYMNKRLQTKTSVYTDAIFWKIPRSSGVDDISLKIGRYKLETTGLLFEVKPSAKAEITLDNEELTQLIEFLQDVYEPFKQGIKKFIPIENIIDNGKVAYLKDLFSGQNQSEVFDLILKHQIIPDELIIGLENAKRFRAIKELKNMLYKDLTEGTWQKWFQENSWILGSEFIGILDERVIDSTNISDFLMEAYDGFIDLVEIKRPEGDLHFWMKNKDHNNYIPSSDLMKAVTQSLKYIYEIEREANSVKFLERVGCVKTIKPRIILIFGRSNEWNTEQKEAYRILNSSFQNINILTYDHVLERAERILGVDNINSKQKK